MLNERVQKNIEEGEVFVLVLVINKGGTFDFASANELWRASVETLDFVPLVNASYSGGIIITDWFNGGDNTNRELKITVRFLTNEIRSDALKVTVHEKICNENNRCKTNLIDSKISSEIQLAILKKAAVLEKNKIEKTVEEFRKEFPTGAGKPKQKKDLTINSDLNLIILKSMERYNFKTIENKWQKFWDKNKSFQNKN